MYKCSYPHIAGVKCHGNCCYSCDHAHVCEVKCAFVSFKKIKPECVYAISEKETDNDGKCN